MNISTAFPVLPSMRDAPKLKRQARQACGQEDEMTNIPGGRRRRCWWPWRRTGRGPGRATPGPGTEGGLTAADAVQLAIGLLTASLDSPELEAWAAQALIPEGPLALGDFLAGLHVVSQLLLQELHQATGQPPAATLQRFAILAEARPGTPFAG
jgi:hypothetical protein